MTDNLTLEQRKFNMSRIRSKNTCPEIIVRKYLYHKGIRYRINSKKLPGKPDIVIRKYNTVIYVNGCFWHGHKNCKKFILPKTNVDYWERKIRNNIKRDKKNLNILRSVGWNVFVIWECQIMDINSEDFLYKMYTKIIDNH